MAAIIDGSTYRKYWKLTPDNGTPTSYYLFPKDIVYFDASIPRIRIVTDVAGATFDFAVDSSTVDENGNALNTNDKVANYLNQNK